MFEFVCNFCNKPLRKNPRRILVILEPDGEARECNVVVHQKCFDEWRVEHKLSFVISKGGY